MFILSDLYTCSPCDYKLKLAGGVREASVRCSIQYCFITGCTGGTCKVFDPVLLHAGGKQGCREIYNAGCKSVFTQ